MTSPGEPAPRPLRIVQVVPSLCRGGAEAFAIDLSDALLRRGHDVHLVHLKDDTSLRHRASPELQRRIHLVHKAGRIDPTLIVRLRRLLTTIRPDVVHTHLFTGMAWGAVAARAAGVRGVFYTEHAAHADDERVATWARRPLSRWLRAVAACSPATAEAVQRHGWAPHARLVVIENGVAVDGRPRAAHADRGGAPMEVGTVGRLVPIKGQQHLIEAAAILRDRGILVHVTIYGDGPLEAELRAQIDARDLGDQVRLAGPTDRVADALAGLDVFVLPSLSEAMPMTLLEAAAAALPLVVTDSGGGPTLLRAGAGGALVPPGDARALADALAHLDALGAAGRGELGARSLAVVRDQFSLDATAAAYESLYLDSR